MQRRKSTPAPRSTRPATGDALPQIELVEISQLGAVIRARRSFEPGTALALGVHLCEGSEQPAPRFLDLEGTVVDCRVVEAAPCHEVAWQVTLLFDSLTESQRSALRHASAANTSWAQSPLQPPVYGGSSFAGWGEFPVQFGLN